VPVSALGALGASLVLLGLPPSTLGCPDSLLSSLGPVLLLIGLGYLDFRTWAERAPAKHLWPDAGG
jgi:hypothetical protein